LSLASSALCTGKYGLPVQEGGGGVEWFARTVEDKNILAWRTRAYAIHFRQHRLRPKLCRQSNQPHQVLGTRVSTEEENLKTLKEKCQQKCQQTP
jgi:hypothetical protein